MMYSVHVCYTVCTNVRVYVQDGQVGIGNLVIKEIF